MSALHDDALTTANTVRLGINDIRWWPNAVETRVANNWLYLLLIPLIIWALVSFFCPEVMGERENFVAFAMFLTPLVLALLICGLVFTGWQVRFVRLFVKLAADGVIRSPSETSTDCVAYALDLFVQRSASKWRYLAAVIALSFASFPILGVWLSAPTDVDSVASRWYWVFFFSVVISFLAWGYATGVGAWTLCAAGRTIRDLPRLFSVQVRLGHPDNCGGFRPVGVVCLGGAMPAITGIGVVACWSLIARHALSSAAVLLGPAALLLVVTAAAAFIVPLWTVHTFLSDARDAYEQRYAAIVDEHARRIQHAAPEISDVDYKLLGDRLTASRLLDPESVKFPRWPFDARIFARFLAPQLLVGLVTAAAKLFFAK